jgi:hypothetical protein
VLAHRRTGSLGSGGVCRLVEKSGFGLISQSLW